MQMCPLCLTDDEYEVTLSGDGRAWIYTCNAKADLHPYSWESEIKDPEKELRQAQALRGGRGVEIPKSVKDIVLKRDGGRCVACEIPGQAYPPAYFGEPLEFDHKIPVSRGGTNEASNVHLLCLDRNRKKGNRTWDEYRRDLS